MKIFKKKVELKSEKQIDFINITEDVENVIEKSGIKNGQVLVFSPHSTASIMINHNEPMLMQDITRLLFRLSPAEERYSHDLFELNKKNKSDGRSNAHSHCKNILLGCNENIILEKGELLLGENQTIFFIDLDGARKRDCLVQVMGE